jgi:hypothetical protein
MGNDCGCVFKMQKRGSTEKESKYGFAKLSSFVSAPSVRGTHVNVTDEHLDHFFEISSDTSKPSRKLFTMRNVGPVMNRHRTLWLELLFRDLVVCLAPMAVAAEGQIRRTCYFWS